jgi:hypothetical protein
MASYMTRSISGLILTVVTLTGLQAPACAGMVGTGAVIDQQQAAADRERLLDALSREDVREQLIAMGVDPRQARERVAALSDGELRAAAGHMRDLPAGGDVLGVALLVFLVLLFTDIMGYTDVFPFVKKTVH